MIVHQLKIIRVSLHTKKILLLQKLYEVAERNNSELVYCDYSFYPKKIGTKEKWFRPYVGKKDVDFIERNNQPWNKLVKRELLENLNIGKMFETWFDEAYIKVLIHAKNPISIEDKLYYYRVGNGSMSSSYRNVEHYEKFVKASIALKNEMHNESEYWIEYFDYRIIYYTLMAMLVAANAKDKETYQRLKRRLETLPNLKNNMHLDHILDYNFGKTKAFAIKKLIPADYQVARMLAIISLRKSNKK